MSYRWPADTDFTLLELDVLDRDCPVCGRRMHICDHRHRRLHTLQGPWQLVCKLNHCPDLNCPGHAKTKGPEIEATIAPPQWAIGWDVFCWIGHRRFARHWAVPQIQEELLDAYGIPLSDTAITQFTRRYQTMVAARQQDPEHLRQHYEGVGEIILTIDGIQPEKGHETLDVVRELTRKRVWFAEPLISASDDEVRRLIVTAKEWAQSLGKTVKLWISDKQEAFVKGIAAEFPDVAHRYCANHFLRDLAKPILEADSHAKVQMRKKVRGLRTIEKTVLEHQRGLAEGHVTVMGPESAATASCAPAAISCGVDDSAAAVVLDYCAAVRGIVNDDQGAPFIRLACGWPRDWDRSGSRSNATWTQKKGVRREATEPSGRLHRPWFDPGSERARDDSRVCEGDPGGVRNAGAWDGELPAAPGEVRRVESAVREGPQPDS